MPGDAALACFELAELSALFTLVETLRFSLRTPPPQKNGLA